MAQWYDTFKPAKSDHTLPVEKPAGQMRYKHAINWEVDLAGFGVGARQGVGSWSIYFKTPSGQVIFSQKVTVTLFLVSLGLPPVQFFIWNAYKELIETDNVGGNVVTKKTIGPYVQGGTSLSEQGLLDPAAGGGQTDVTATIITDWYSPIYRNFRIPPGTKVFATADSWGFGPTTVEYGWAFKDADGNLLDTTFDRFGALLSARGKDNSSYLRTGRAWAGYAEVDPGAWVKGSEPTIIEMPDGREFLAVLDETAGYIEYVSYNSELTWNRVQYPDKTTGRKSAQSLFSPGGTMPKMIVVDENRVVLEERGGKLNTRVVGDDGLGETVFVGAAVAGQYYSLDREPDGALIIVNNTGLPVFRSKSIPLRWVDVPLPEGVTA